MTARLNAAAPKGGRESSIREDETTLDAMAVPGLTAKEQRRGVVVLHNEQSVVATEAEMRRGEPLDASANVSCEERLVVLDPEQPRFAVRRERDAPEAAGEIRDEHTVVSTGVDDHIAVIHPGAW